MAEEKMQILVTGATGYIGGRLWRLLAKEGRAVRCMVREPAYLEPHTRGTDVTVVRGDVLAPDTLRDALAGVRDAYYLVHAMGAGDGFEAREQAGARNFAAAAAEAGVERIIYVGGLAPAGPNLSRHMESRQSTGRALAATGVPVVELRASIVIGAGSLSYEMIRALVQKLPFMVTPAWTRVEAQPIAIDDLLAYLVEALRIPVAGHDIYEIGGTDVVSYFGLMQAYTRRRGRRLIALPAPFLSPRISSLWLGLVTPLYARVGRKLIDSCSTPSIITNPSAREAFEVRPMGVDEAIQRAQESEDRMFLESHWSDSVSSGRVTRSWGGVRFGTRLVDTREMCTRASTDDAFAAVQRIGGATGYYFADFLWRMRGAIDLLVGGVGMRRGRRDPEHLAPGDAVDFWRVERVEAGQRLVLQAEMKLPGRAWLEFEVEADEDGGARIRQTAIFDPVGTAGLAYWYGIYPLHGLIFRGMLRGLCRAAEGPKGAA